MWKPSGDTSQSLFRKAFKKAKVTNICTDEDSELSFSKRDNTEPCYACAQKGLPRFHSVSCEANHPLFLETNAGSSLYPVSSQQYLKPPHISKQCSGWIFGAVQDPRRSVIKKLNRSFLLARLISLAIDPLFFYVLAIRTDHACVHIEVIPAAVVTFLRISCDAFHGVQIWLQLKLAYVSKKSLILGRGSLVWDPREIALHYLQSGGGFWFDLFVILPVPQVILWIVLPHMISKGEVEFLMPVFLITFLLQYLPKVVHLVFLARRMRLVTGFVFGTVWWGFALNLTAYLLAGHVAGACWYLLATQRVVDCLIDQCTQASDCNVKLLGCSSPSYQSSGPNTMAVLLNNQTSLSQCFESQGIYNYGIFQLAVSLVTGHAWLSKLLFPIFWGLMNLSTFGNALVPSNDTLEVFFSIVFITCGLLLFALLIGNIQVFLNSITAKKEAMKLRLRDLEHWMCRRQLPSRLRQRVRRYERHHWAATRGVDEGEMIRGLPEGLTRDIKQHLSFDLVRKVPLFEHLDKLVLENMCGRLKPHLFIKDEVVIREGDPVQRMLFIVRGHLLSSHDLNNGNESVCCLGPGNFCGDELLAWCLRKPFVERLPPSFATLTSVESTEAFGLEAQDLKFVTEHFHYRFVSDSVKRTARYYSSGWRTWAVVTIQLAWRRYQTRRAQQLADQGVELPSLGRPASLMPPLARSRYDGDRLRLYAAMFTSHKPQDQR